VFHCRDLYLIGDKAYNDTELEERLWRKRRILLLPLLKDNQKKQWPDDIRRTLERVRHHRVEAVFSMITTVFNIQRPRGRNLAGHRVILCFVKLTVDEC
jgi:hypothetical protein